MTDNTTTKTSSNNTEESLVKPTPFVYSNNEALDFSNPELFDLFMYIMGDNKNNKCYFNPNDIASLIEAINHNAQKLLDLHINDCEHENYEHIRHLQMNILFGPNWESQYQNATINKATKQIDKLADKLEHPEITAKQIADKLRNNASIDILNRDNKPSEKPIINSFSEIMPTYKTLTSNNANQDNQDEEYEFVDSPEHYNTSSVETIEKIRRIYGDDATALWCEITAFKYRDRIGSKPGEPVSREVRKIQWYESKAKELRTK